MALRRRAGPSRRGEFFPFVPAAAQAAPVRAPDWLQRRRPVPRRTARGEFFPLAGQNVGPAPARIVARRRPSRTPVRRGEMWPLPLVGAVAGLGPWLPQPLARRRTPAQTRRGEFFVVPLAGLAPLSPPVIAPLLSHRPVRALPRRGEFLPVVAAPSYAAAPLRRRARPTACGRRGRMWAAPPVPLLPAGPGPWLPRTLRATARSSPRRAPRSRFWPMSIEHVGGGITPRPFTGTTARPGTGITVRPNSGVTLRP